MRLLRAIVFTVGASTLGAEIAAARLMAPFFGASTIVWANTIATVLVALSVGYWLGGRLADRRPHLDRLARWVLFASVLLALVPLVAGPFLDLSVSAFDEIDVGAALGSLVGVLALVAVPVLLLGAVSPWAIRLSVDRVEDAGRAAGSLYALSTLGSLLGTFLAALVLVPLVGTQRTFLLFAAAVALVAALALPRRHLLGGRRRRRAAAAPDGQHEGDRGLAPARGARDARPVRARDRAARRRAAAGAQRGPGLPLGLATRHGAHRQRLGRLPVDAGQRARPRAALRRGARQRRRHDRAGLRRAVPGHGDGRGGDRRRADRARAGAGSACATAPACGCTRTTRGRSCAAPSGAGR